jgi:hypothetical protein
VHLDIVDADKGCENHQPIKTCEDAGIMPYTYIPLTAKADPTRHPGRFTF